MSDQPDKDRPRKSGRKVRVDLRRNRSRPNPSKDWTRRVREHGEDLDAASTESVVAKGALSRKRTVIVDNEATERERIAGVVVVMRGLYADVDDGRRVIPCTVRRLLRSRLIAERHPVTVGDHVKFTVPDEAEGRELEGVIEDVLPRRSELTRIAGRRHHTIVANVDQLVIVSSADQPTPRPRLIDRYIVAGLAGRMQPVLCMNKMDLDRDGDAEEICRVYEALGYRTIRASAADGTGIDQLRAALHGVSSVIAGQSGVGKSSLLNAVQPGLGLRVGEISEQSERGRHTTTTARLLRLDAGGYVVDTPGVRSFDVSAVPRGEIESYFVEFLEHIPDCRFPDCTHTHEVDCAVKAAVEAGAISAERYDSYVRMFTGEDTSEG